MLANSFPKYYYFVLLSSNYHYFIEYAVFVHENKVVGYGSIEKTEDDSHPAAEADKHSTHPKLVVFPNYMARLIKEKAYQNIYRSLDDSSDWSKFTDWRERAVADFVREFEDEKNMRALKYQKQTAASKTDADEICKRAFKSDVIPLFQQSRRFPWCSSIDAGSGTEMLDLASDEPALNAETSNLVSIYEDLHRKNLFALGGLKFGGDLCAYTNYPWLVHSFSIISLKESEDEKIEMSHLISHCRMSSHVGKSYTISSVCNDNPHAFQYFSFSYCPTKEKGGGV